MIRVKGDGNMITFYDIFSWFNGGCQQGLSNANFPYVCLTNKYQRVHLSTENILPCWLVF